MSYSECVMYQAKRFMGIFLGFMFGRIVALKLGYQPLLFPWEYILGFTITYVLIAPLFRKWLPISKEA